MSLFQLKNVSVSELLFSDGSLPSSRRSALRRRGILAHLEELLGGLRFFFVRQKSCAGSPEVGSSGVRLSWFWKGSTRNLKEYVHLQ